MKRELTLRAIYRNLRLSIHCLAAALAVSASALAQTAEEHAIHHPAAEVGSPAAMEPAPPGPSAGAGKGAARPGEQGMDGMMGGVPPRELYPSLMQVKDISHEKRAELERLARERMASGIALMSAALERLPEASTTRDLPTMQDAAAQMREGVLQFESGVATLGAIAEGKEARATALDWLKRSMSLLPAADMESPPHGIFGLSAFHYFSMLVLVVLVASMILVNIGKMRRTAALTARLAGGVERQARPASQSAPSAIPGAAVAQAVPLPLKPEEVPSLPNSWTGLLRVVRIFEETPNVRTLRLADPSGGEAPFRHLPGQFLTITVKPVDRQVKRSYTIASSPTRRDYVEVTVKREDHGTVSSFLHHAHEGDTLQVTGPSGSFTFLGEGANSIVLVSGGVGITPMMSVLRFLTDRSWRGDIYFIFACRSDQDVVFREELEYLQRRHANVHLTICANDVARADWPYAKGRVTKELLAEVVPHIATRRVHICGPGAMMDAVKSALSELGVPADQIRTEVFIGKERPVTPAQRGLQAEPVVVAPVSEPGAAVEPQTQVAVVTFARSNQTAMLAPDRTVLEASEDVGVNIDYSCRVGVCGICKVKLLKGSVTMEVQDALTADDKQNDMILACQAKATADVSVDA